MAHVQPKVEKIGEKRLALVAKAKNGQISHNTVRLASLLLSFMSHLEEEKNNFAKKLATARTHRISSEWFTVVSPVITKIQKPRKRAKQLMCTQTVRHRFNGGQIWQTGVHSWTHEAMTETQLSGLDKWRSSTRFQDGRQPPLPQLPFGC
jgi:hypothetical protein